MEAANPQNKELRIKKYPDTSEQDLNYGIFNILNHVFIWIIWKLQHWRKSSLAKVKILLKLV